LTTRIECSRNQNAIADIPTSEALWFESFR